MSTATATSMKLTAEQESENARINAENERLRKQARAKRTISLTLSYVALALVTFLMIFPLIIVVIVSFTPNAVTQTWPPKIIPSAWTLDNYTSLFQRLPIGRELLNTIVFAGAVTIISVFFAVRVSCKIDSRSPPTACPAWTSRAAASCSPCSSPP